MIMRWLLKVQILAHSKFSGIPPKFLTSVLTFDHRIWGKSGSISMTLIVIAKLYIDNALLFSILHYIYIKVNVSNS